MRLAVFGSRSLSDGRVRDIIVQEIGKHGPAAIVTSAEPEGVCEVARKVCKDLAIPLELHFLNSRYLGGMFENRSKEIISGSNHVLLIYDGESKGTAGELKLTKKAGRPYTLHVLEKESKGFDLEMIAKRAQDSLEEIMGGQ